MTMMIVRNLEAMVGVISPPRRDKIVSPRSRQTSADDHSIGNDDNSHDDNDHDLHDDDDHDREHGDDDGDCNQAAQHW